jgi:alpha-glucuronidase
MIRLVFGDGSDLADLSHMAVTSTIENDRDWTHVRLHTTDFRAYELLCWHRVHDSCQCRWSDVQLFYDNAEKLATTATGIDVTGTVTADGLTVTMDNV